MTSTQWSITTAYTVVGAAILVRHNWPKRIAAWSRAQVKPQSGTPVPGSTGAGNLPTVG